MRIMKVVILFGLTSGLLFSACSDDDNPPTPDTKPMEAGVLDVGDKDGGGDPCTGKADGDACGSANEGTICLSGACVASVCGDGYVDANAAEDCEDGNELAGDGCTDCAYDCKADADCDDSATCNGAETCDTTAHTCTAGTNAADGTDCTQPDSSAGKCKTGLCVSAGCGNGVPDANEDCDDGNQVSGDGCENDCKYSCAADADCDDQDLCTGVETCDTTAHTCTAGTAVKCTVPATGASPGCTVACDAATGNCIFADGDGDGVTCDTDCKDNDPVIYPGATECNDSKDNDCNGKVDDNATDCLCYYDGDKDGYALKGAAIKTQAPPCPTGYTEKNPATISDCQDSRADVFPGQSTYFTKWYCKIGKPGGLCLLSNQSYDYNCDGTVTKQYTKNVNCVKQLLTGKCVGSGWATGVIAPACGKSASWNNCSSLMGMCYKLKTTTRTQACR